MSALNSHMTENMLTWYVKEHLYKVRHIPADVNNPPKKHTTRDKIEPLGSQKWDLKTNNLG
jgi:hypothetical protein